jgi:hypothetical protein
MQSLNGPVGGETDLGQLVLQFGDELGIRLEVGTLRDSK